MNVNIKVKTIMVTTSLQIVIIYTKVQRCSPRGQALASRRLEAKFYGLGLGLGLGTCGLGLGLGLGLEGPGLGLGLGLESCVDNFWHYPQT